MNEGGRDIHQHLELDRRFRDLTDAEKEDLSRVAQVAGNPLHFPTGWPELLEAARVVILAEAGSGKTQEMRAQAAKLTSQGKAAFFVPIEALTGEDLRDYLAMNEGDAERFDDWVKAEGDFGWFFLDSVDELKLGAGKLDTALGKVARALGPARSRARVVLSCRPTDWRPTDDLEVFQRRLPIAPLADKVVVTDDDSFLAGFRDRNAENPKPAKTDTKPRVVVLTPLGSQQIKAYVTAMCVKDPDGFLEAVDRQDAWSFAQRPLDLEALARSWDARGRLGTRLEQHEADVELSLRERPDRPDPHQISMERAAEGAERLALALFLTSRRTVRVPERSGQDPYDTTSLDPVAILRDWSDGEIGALLRRSIFDPATYGRVRFHHRTVQEFLAAKRLRNLREKGMPARQLNRLLFADLYGERVAIPSARPLAAWLALWEPTILREALEREPEVLLLNGDPSSLPFEARTNLLRAYVEAYGDGGWRGLDMPVTEIRRLALPDMADEVRSCWLAPHTNEEVGQLLLKLIWQGRLTACADIAEVAALGVENSVYTRALGMRGLAECRADEALRRIGANLKGHPDLWPDELVFSMIDPLYPHHLSTTELEALIRRIPEPSKSTGGFSWALYSVVDAIPPRGKTADELRTLLTALLWEGRAPEAKWYELHSAFEHLAGALLKLCAHQLRAGHPIDDSLAWALIVAHRFGNDGTLGREASKELTDVLSTAGAARSLIFEAELKLMSVIAAEAAAEERLYYAHRHSALVGLTPADWDWLISGFERREEARKEVYFRALIDLWFAKEKPARELDILRALADGNEALSAVLEQQLTPRTVSPVWEQMERDHQEHKAQRRLKEEARDESWLKWKAEVEATPATAFADDQRKSTLCLVVKWLTFRGEHSGIARRNWRDIHAFFSPEVSSRFERGLRAYWRETPAPVRSSRPPAERGAINLGVEVGLTGLLIEASGESWVTGLSDAEAELAAAWGTIEIARFPEWMEELTLQRAPQVQAVLRTELADELGGDAATPNPSVLSTVEYGTDIVRSLAVPYLRERLLTWPTTGDEMAAFNHQNLDRVMAVLVKAGAMDTEIASHCETAFFSDPAAEIATTWLQGVVAQDLRRGFEALRKGLAMVPAEVRPDKALQWMASLFGDRDYRHVPILADGEADLLLDLIRLAYEYVRREDDVQHEGVFTPGRRDNAEGARSRLLSSLIGKPGVATHSALVAMAKEPLFQHMPDRLRLMARERAALDSEPGAYTPEAVLSLERRYAAVPNTRDELFATMMDRLDDIDHELRHHDFNERHLLLRETDEKGLQPSFARRLDLAARDAYQVVREDEVADRKKTDIRLLGRAFSGRAVIELKVGDKNTVTTLEAAVRDQLLGQYLRSQDCTAGCLLVTYHGKKGDFHKPGSRKPISFAEVILHLSAFSSGLEAAEGGRVRLGVYGIDLRETAQT